MMNNSQQSAPQPFIRATFVWLAFGLLTVFAATLLWMIADFKRQLLASVVRAEQTTQSVQVSIDRINDRLPGLLSEVETVSTTLGRISEDVELVKSLAGVGNSESNRAVRSLAEYADELQEVLQNSSQQPDAVILIEEVVGSDLKVTETVSEFLVGLNKEMVVAILPLSKSKQEILYRATRSSVRRKPYHIRIGDDPPMLLEQYIRNHHPGSRELPEFAER